MLPASLEAGGAARLVHREYLGHEQHQQAASGMDEVSGVTQHVEIGTGQRPARRGTGKLVERTGVLHQDEYADDGQPEFENDPPVPEQTPRGPQ